MNAAGTTVAISAYNNATHAAERLQPDRPHRLGADRRVRHTLLVGTEFGRQDTDQLPQHGLLHRASARTSTTFNAPLGAPTISLPLTFRQNATDADNQSVATVAAAYAQDQIALTSHLEAVVGLRFDSFDADVTNNRTATDFSSHDGLLSPRVGLVYKPTRRCRCMAATRSPTCRGPASSWRRCR